MIVIIEPKFDEVELWKVTSSKIINQASSQILKIDRDIKLTLEKAIKNMNHDEEIKAISVRLLIGGDIFDRITLVDDSFFEKFKQLFDIMPLYVTNTMNFMKNLYEVFYDIPILVFVETGFFRELPEAERYYAVPNNYFNNNSFKRWGFHGIWHSYNYNIPLNINKTISIVIDNYTTVCAIRKDKPVTVSFGCTPLEGIMGEHSCGEIDPGIVFYLMHHMGYSVQKIDEILKKQSGFLGLTGQNMEINEMLKYCGKEDAINQAVVIYFNQLKKYVGESMAILNGVSDIVFSGKSIESLVPIIFYLIKDMSYFDIALNPLPWLTKEKINRVTTKESKIQVYINTQTLPEIIYSLTVAYIKANNRVNNYRPQKLKIKGSMGIEVNDLKAKYN